MGHTEQEQSVTSSTWALRAYAIQRHTELTAQIWWMES